MCELSHNTQCPLARCGWRNWELACAEEQLDVPYQEVKEVVFIGRGIGAWGDMVITLKNNDKIEMRSLPRCVVIVGDHSSPMASACIVHLPRVRLQKPTCGTDMSMMHSLMKFFHW